MGLWAKLPFALAPGMGLNAFFAFTVMRWAMAVPWDIALAQFWFRELSSSSCPLHRSVSGPL